MAILRIHNSDEDIARFKSAREAACARVAAWPKWKREVFSYRKPETENVHPNKLEPCLFCGSEDVLIMWDASCHSVSVECQKCAANGPLEYTEQDAIDGWNRHDKTKQK
jgi:Lar family restriction alleviation protein